MSNFEIDIEGNFEGFHYRTYREVDTGCRVTVMSFDCLAYRLVACHSPNNFNNYGWQLSLVNQVLGAAVAAEYEDYITGTLDIHPNWLQLNEVITR